MASGEGSKYVGQLIRRDDAILQTHVCFNQLTWEAIAANLFQKSGDIIYAAFGEPLQVILSGM